MARLRVSASTETDPDQKQLIAAKSQVLKSFLTHKEFPMEADTPTPASERTTSSKSPAPPLSRSELIQQYREQSLQRTHPLAANLAVITSDLMVFAQGNAELASPPSPEASPEVLQRFERQANLQLRIVRQICQLTGIDQELENRRESHPGAPEAKN